MKKDPLFEYLLGEEGNYLYQITRRLISWRSRFDNRVSVGMLKCLDLTYEEVGKVFGITRQRAHQIALEFPDSIWDDILDRTPGEGTEFPRGRPGEAARLGLYPPATYATRKRKVAELVRHEPLANSIAEAYTWLACPALRGILEGYVKRIKIMRSMERLYPNGIPLTEEGLAEANIAEKKLDELMR